MPPYQARSNACRSGVTRSGWSTRNLICKIGGVTRPIDHRLTINESFDVQTPNRCIFRTADGTFTVSPGQEVIIGAGHIDNRIFGGHVVGTSTRAEFGGQEIRWEVDAQDYSWVLNNDDVVFGAYENAGVSAIVNDILYKFTDGTFRPGLIPSTLGNLTIKFDGDSVSSALSRIAKEVDATPFCDYTRRVSMVQYRTDGNTLTADDSTVLDDLTYAAENRQIRNRVLVAGGGNNLAYFARNGDPTLLVEGASWDLYYAAGGGTVLLDNMVITYTSAVSERIDSKTDTGTVTTAFYVRLLGVSGLIRDVPPGAQVRLLAEVSDSARQTAMATLLGGGSPGVVTHFINESRLPLAGATARATSAVAGYGDLNETVSFSLVDDRYQVGKRVTMGTTSPLAISGLFTIRQIVIVAEDDGMPTSSAIRWRRKVVASRYVHDLTVLLRRLVAAEER